MECKSDMAVIVEGVMSVLQPLNTSVNKSFKDYVRHLYSEPMETVYQELTKTATAACGKQMDLAVQNMIFATI